MIVARTLVLVGAAAFLASCAWSPDLKIEGLFGFKFPLAAPFMEFLVAVLLGAVIVLSVLLIRRPRRQSAGGIEPFPYWLANRDGAADPDLKDLQNYSHNMNWRTNDINQLRNSIEDDGVISPTDKVRRAMSLGRWFGQWQNQPSAGPNALSQFLRDIRENGTTIFLSLFALAVFIALAVGLSNSSFFTSLAQVDQARGLITFLVAICAVAVILLTAINIFWTVGADFKDRFSAAKDLVTIVMGVLGTILGFYFGFIQ
jgi:hypothetical protein